MRRFVLGAVGSLLVATGAFLPAPAATAEPGLPAPVGAAALVDRSAGFDGAVPLLPGGHQSTPAWTVMTPSAVYSASRGPDGTELLRIPLVNGPDGPTPGPAEAIGSFAYGLATHGEEIAFVRADDGRIVIRAADGSLSLPPVPAVASDHGARLALSSRWLAVDDMVFDRSTGAAYSLSATWAPSQSTATRVRLTEDRALFATWAVHSGFTVLTVPLGPSGPEGPATVLETGTPTTFPFPIDITDRHIVWETFSYTADGLAAGVVIRSLARHSPDASPTDRPMNKDVSEWTTARVVGDELLIGGRSVGGSQNTLRAMSLTDGAAEVATLVPGTVLGVDGTLVTFEAHGQLWLLDRTGRPLAPPEGSAPTVTGMDARLGSTAGGTSAVLTGTDFTGVTDVLIGDARATFEVRSASEIVVVTPPGSLGEAAVSVRTVHGVAEGPAFRYVDPVTFITPWRAFDATVAPDRPTCFQVSGTVDVPAEAAGVVVNVTAANTSGPGNAVVYPEGVGPDGARAPVASTVNFERGVDVANATWVAVGPAGRVCVESRGAPSARLVVDVTAYVLPKQGIDFLTPRRVLDTRQPTRSAQLTGPLRPRTPTTFDVTRALKVHERDLRGVMLNVTVTGATRQGNLRVYNANMHDVDTSVLNYVPGVDKSAGVLVEPGFGEITFWSDTSSDVHVVVDVVGSVDYRGYVRGARPERLIDTRAGYSSLLQQTGRLRAGTVRSFPVGRRAPEGTNRRITGVVLTVTAVGADGLGNLRVFGEGAGLPKTSNLNLVPGRAVANQVVVPVTDDGMVHVYTDMARGRSVDVLIDVVGYINGA